MPLKPALSSARAPRALTTKVFSGAVLLFVLVGVAALFTRDSPPLWLAPDRYPPLPSTEDGAVGEARSAEILAAVPRQARYNAHILLDRPVFRAGDVVRGHVSFFNVLDHTPLAGRLGASVQILGPRGEQMDAVHLDLSGKVGAFAWPIPAGASGGDYQAQVQTWDAAVPVSRRGFEVRGSRAQPKLVMALHFAKEGYAPGEQVAVALQGSRLEGATVSFTCQVDGKVVFASPAQPWSAAPVTFTLPAKVEQGHASVTAAVTLGAVFESATKTLPLVLARVDLEALPESGHTTCHLPGNVYVEALDGTSGRPVDFEAELVDRAGRVLGVVKSAHEGRGKALVAGSPGPLTLRLVKPMRGPSVDVPFRCSRAHPELNAGFQVDSGVVDAGEPLRATVRSLAPGRAYRLAVFKREVELGAFHCAASGWTSAAGGGGECRVSVELDGHPQVGKARGVLRVTLFETGSGLPVAERLVFREPASRLVIDITARVADSTERGEEAAEDAFAGRAGAEPFSAAPADGVQLRVETYTLDKQGRKVPQAAAVSLRVADAGLASTLEQRLLPPRMSAGVLLEPELDRMHGWHAFGMGAWAWHGQPGREPGSVAPAVALDLALGTQGWRRFAYHNLSGFLAPGKQLERRERMVGFRVPPPVPQFVAGGVGRAFGNKMMLMGNQQHAVDAMPAMAMMVQEDDGAGNGVPPMAPPPMPGMAQDMAQDMAHGVVQDVVQDMARDAVQEMAPRAPMPPPMGALAMPAMPAMGAMRQRAAPMALKQRGASLMPFSRVFRHPQRKYTKKEFDSGPVRADFAETLYTNPELQTVCANGRCVAWAHFGLSDLASATVCVHADGVSSDGQAALGEGALAFVTKLPLEVDVAVPAALTRGDTAMLPVTVQGQDGAAQLRASVQGEAGPRAPRDVTWAADRAGKRLGLVVDASLPLGEVNVTVRASSPRNKDAVSKSFRVLPAGFPQALDLGGTLLVAADAHEVELPADMVPGSLRPRVRVYTNPVGRLTAAVEALVREPCGCFEQTSSATFPLVFAVQYLSAHSAAGDAGFGASGGVLTRAREMLRRGVSKLLSFETSTGGFEWFGASPGHEALTAYGLVQFAAMASEETGMPGLIPAGLVERVAAWVDKRRDGKGGYLRSEKSLDSFGAAPQATTDAYITWALTQAGVLRAGGREVDALARQGRDSPDPYIIALAALAVGNVPGRTAEALGLARRLADMQDVDGGAVRAVNTITRSMGEALQVEATALACLAFLRHDALAGNARRAVDFLAASCKDGRFASTQATALSLMAIVQYERRNAKPLPPGSVLLEVDGRTVGSFAFGASPPRKQAQAALVSSVQPCSGGQVWTECGSACTSTCTEAVEMCTMQCVARCQCPPELPVLDTSDGNCKTQDMCAKAPPVAAQAAPDAEGVMEFGPMEILKAVGAKAKFQVRLRVTWSAGAVPLPYSVHFDYSVRKPKSASQLEFQVAFAAGGGQAAFRQGQAGLLRVSLANPAATALGMVVAVVALPAGLETRPDQLRELKDAGAVDFVEVDGSGAAVFYFRGMGPRSRREWTVEVAAVLPGEFQGAASRAYVFYQDELKTYVPGLKAKVEAAEGTEVWA